MLRKCRSGDVQDVCQQGEITQIAPGDKNVAFLPFEKRIGLMIRVFLGGVSASNKPKLLRVATWVKQEKRLRVNTAEMYTELIFNPDKTQFNVSI